MSKSVVQLRSFGSLYYYLYYYTHWISRSGKAFAPVSSGAYMEIGEQRSQANNAVQILKGDGYIYPLDFKMLARHLRRQAAEPLCGQAIEPIQKEVSSAVKQIMQSRS